MKKSIEKNLEKALKKRVFQLGGRTVKLSAKSDKGWPDQLILMPNGKTYFREIKDEGLEPSDLQKYKIKLLRDLGFDAGYINSWQGLNDFTNKIRQ